MMKIKFLFAWTILGLGLAVGIMTGCEIDSAENSTRNPGLTVEGFYIGQGGGPIVPSTTGNPVQNMNLMQNGDQLEVIDNNGIIFRGSLGQVVDDRASFTLRGQATSGQEATISGNFNVDGTTSTMRGSWIENSLVSTVFGTAVVPSNRTPVATNGNPNVANVTISPSSLTLNPSQTGNFTANGGTGTFVWSQSNDQAGTLSTPQGVRDERVTYTASTTTGTTTTLTVRDQSGGANARSATAQITVQTPPAMP